MIISPNSGDLRQIEQLHFRKYTKSKVTHDSNKSSCKPLSNQMPMSTFSTARSQEYSLGCITFVLLFMFVLLTNIRYVTLSIPFKHNMKIRISQTFAQDADHTTPTFQHASKPIASNSEQFDINESNNNLRSSLIPKPTDKHRYVDTCIFQQSQTYNCENIFDSQYYRIKYDLHHLLAYPPSTKANLSTTNSNFSSNTIDIHSNSSTTSNTNILSIKEEESILKEHYLKIGIHNGYTFHPGPKSMKIILMTMNEWPMLKSWVLYHGHFFGFQNLCIVSGCTEKEPLLFLKQVNHLFGVNVLYTKASLNEIGDQIGNIMKSLQFSSDFITKVDTDEFISYYNVTANTLHPERVLHHLTYELPYIGGKYKFGYRMSAFPIKLAVNHSSTATDTHNSERTNIMTVGQAIFEPIDKYEDTSKVTVTTVILDTPRILKYFQKPILENMKGNGKTLYASPTFGTFDLGNHRGRTLPAFQNIPDCQSNLVNIHYHFQSHSQVQENNKKALLSHGYINYTDSIDVQIIKCEELILKAPPSRHKLKDYLDYLRNPELHEKLYYQRFYVGINTKEHINNTTATTTTTGVSDNLIQYTGIIDILSELYVKYNYV